MSNIATLKIPISNTANPTYIKQGDTVPKIVFTFSDDDDIDLTTSTIKMQIYNGSKAIIDITNDSGITVVSSKVFEIDEITANDFPYGKFLGDLEITDANDKRFTYMNVEYTILQQYTK